jgi:hypothetical protein
MCDKLLLNMPDESGQAAELLAARKFESLQNERWRIR